MLDWQHHLSAKLRYSFQDPCGLRDPAGNKRCCRNMLTASLNVDSKAYSSAAFRTRLLLRNENLESFSPRGFTRINGFAN